MYALYKFKARFSKGDATLEVGLQHEDGEWRISWTNFNSESLFKKALKQEQSTVAPKNRAELRS